MSKISKFVWDYHAGGVMCGGCGLHMVSVSPGVFSCVTREGYLGYPQCKNYGIKLQVPKIKLKILK